MERIVFHEMYSPEEIVKKISKATMKILQHGDRWWFNLIPHDALEVCQTLKMIQSCKVFYVWLDCNYCPQIGKSIFNITFQYLKFVDLKKNKLVQFQPIALLNTNILESIDISENLLTNCKGFRKSKFSFLTTIKIDNNLIQNYEGFDYLDSFKFDLLQVEDSKYHNKKSLTWIFKLKAVNVRQLEIGIWGMHFKKGNKYQLHLSQFKMIKQKFDDFKHKQQLRLITRNTRLVRMLLGRQNQPLLTLNRQSLKKQN